MSIYEVLTSIEVFDRHDWIQIINMTYNLLEMELIRRASAEIEKMSLWRIFRNLWNDKAGSSLGHALGNAYLHQMPSFYDSNRDPSAMRKPTGSIEVMSAAPTVTRNRKPRQWGECFAPHLPLWIFKRGSATSFGRSYEISNFYDEKHSRPRIVCIKPGKQKV